MVRHTRPTVKAPISLEVEAFFIFYIYLLSTPKNNEYFYSNIQRLVFLLQKYCYFTFRLHCTHNPRGTAYP